MTNPFFLLVGCLVIILLIDIRAYGQIESLLGGPEFSNHTWHIMKAAVFSQGIPSPLKGATPKGVAYAPGARDTSDYTKAALKLWLVKEFLDMYSKYSVPGGQDQINAGKKIFDSLKLTSFVVNGISGVVHDLPTTSLLEMVDLWKQKELISETDREEFKRYLTASDFQKTSRGSVLVRNNGELIYSQVGYSTTQLIGYSRGTWAYTFRKVKFSMAPTVTTTYTKDCFLWNIFCKTKTDVKTSDRTLTGQEAEQLGAYIRAEAIKQFNDDNHQAILVLQAKARQFSPFLPDDIKKAVQEIDSNPDKRPDDLYPKDPLDGNNFDL